MTEFLHVSRTGSTNYDVLQGFRAGEVPRPILADHQTAGRGRLGRTWHNDRPSGGNRIQAMLGSVPQTWSASQSGISLVPFVAGLAAIEVVESAVSSAVVGLSWPNDVVAMHEGKWRKLAGILVESHPMTDRTIGVAVGIGLNLWPLRDAGDEAVVRRAISLVELESPDPDARDLFVQFCRHLADWTERLRTESRPVMAHYRKRCCTIGQSVEVQLSDALLSGEAVDVADSGELIVDRLGRHHRITVGDVVLRPD